IFQSEVKRFGDERMADRNFQKPRNVFFEKSDVIQTQIVTGVNAKPDGLRAQGSFDIRFDPFLVSQSVLMSERFGVKFDAIGSGLGSAFNLIGDWIDKN